MTRETKSTKTAQRQKKDRDRQQSRRDNMVAERRPETHAVDRAVSEAVAYVMAGHGMAGIPPLEIVVSVAEVSQVARTILAKRYDYELSGAAVVKRLSPRPKMRWTLPAPTARNADDI